MDFGPTVICNGTSASTVRNCSMTIGSRDHLMKANGLDVNSHSISARQVYQRHFLHDTFNERSCFRPSSSIIPSPMDLKHSQHPAGESQSASCISNSKQEDSKHAQIENSTISCSSTQCTNIPTTNEHVITFISPDPAVNKLKFQGLDYPAPTVNSEISLKDTQVCASFPSCTAPELCDNFDNFSRDELQNTSQFAYFDRQACNSKSNKAGLNNGRQIGLDETDMKVRVTVLELNRATTFPSCTDRNIILNAFKLKRVNSSPTANSSIIKLFNNVSQERSATPISTVNRMADMMPVTTSTTVNPVEQHKLANQTASESPHDIGEEEQVVTSETVENANGFTESNLVRSKSGSSGRSSHLLTDDKDGMDDRITPVFLNRPSMIVNNNASFASDPRSRTCCFCWCCCCSCSCIRVKPNLGETKRPNGSDDPQSDLEEEKLTHAEVRSWADSFDLLMQSPGGRKVFREFLRSEYSEENILFWLACEDLKKETNPEIVEEKARMIYEDFISILSPREVSLDSRVREIINANMIEPTPRTFDEAQMQIYTLMRRDSYLRFLNSKVYKDLLQQTSEKLSNISLNC